MLQHISRPKRPRPPLSDGLTRIQIRVIVGGRRRPVAAGSKLEGGAQGSAQRGRQTPPPTSRAWAGGAGSRQAGCRAAAPSARVAGR